MESKKFRGTKARQVDFANGKIKVCKSLTLHGEDKDPKTRTGNRTISVDAGVVAHLVNLRAKQARNLKKIDIVQTAQTPVCCSDIGGYGDVATYERWWGTWRKKHGFDDLKFHELRHTQATVLFANGVDVKTVQTRLGHADASLTLNTYAHAIPENDEAAAELIGNVFTDKGEARIIDLKTG